MNVELLKKVRDQIRAHPDLHDQSYYGMQLPCGTKHCIAGWACVLSGAQPVWSAMGTMYDVRYEGRQYASFDLAAELIGLDESQASELFLEFHDNFSLRLLDEAIDAGERGEPWTPCI